MQVELDAIELRVIRLPLVEAFQSGHALRRHREVVIVRAITGRSEADGWAECVAEIDPTYWPEYTAGALHVLEHHLVPRALAGASLHEVRGNNMAKAALEGAIIDAGLRAEGRSVAEFLGADRREVTTGIALGITQTVDELVASARRWCGEGHRALKLKVTPAWDISPVRAVREAVGSGVALLVDANGSYRSDFPGHRRALRNLAHESLGLVAIEQPFPPDDLTGHIALAVDIGVDVPVCLDESIGSLGDLDTALALAGLAGVTLAVNLKVGRVGGLLEAHRIHQRCVEHSVPLRAGGMLETGLGRALNLAVAALPGCTLPPDLAPSSRYFARDITPPFRDRDGTLSVPTGPGLGVEPIQEVLDEVTEKQIILRAST
ncbi:MAG TPA: enolase C-terminal domain-like protein [Acidimicrobiales bacterium]|jgi:O-succinylbenzoate synthase